MKFENILVVEDHEVANLSLRRTLEDLQYPLPKHAHYCDHALTMIKAAQKNGQPYDLLITDLYFQADGSNKELPDGMELIKACRTVQPDLKILVFSAESRPAVIMRLYEDFAIDGYVRKARGDAQDLKAALEQVASHKRFYLRENRSLVQQANQHTFSEYDKAVVRLLAAGYAQKDISNWLEERAMPPWGLSSVEKRLNLMKTAMNFSKNEQLVLFCKEIGLI
jgi:two-component system capsular synthesis response regulator RcsB